MGKKTGAPARGICPLCKREWTLRRDGLLRTHLCPGTPVTGYHQGGGIPATVTRRATPPESPEGGLTKAWLQQLEAAVMIEIDKHDAVLVKPSVAWRAFFKVLWEKYADLERSGKQTKRRIG